MKSKYPNDHFQRFRLCISLNTITWNRNSWKLCWHISPPFYATTLIEFTIISNSFSTDAVIRLISPTSFAQLFLDLINWKFTGIHSAQTECHSRFHAETYIQSFHIHEHIHLTLLRSIIPRSFIHSFSFPIWIECIILPTRELLYLFLKGELMFIARRRHMLYSFTQDWIIDIVVRCVSLIQSNFSTKPLAHKKKHSFSPFISFWSWSKFKFWLMLVIFIVLHRSYSIQFNRCSSHVWLIVVLCARFIYCISVSHVTINFVDFNLIFMRLIVIRVYSERGGVLSFGE